MHFTVYLLLAAPAALAFLGPRLTRQLAPAAVIRTLSALSLTAVAATVWGLTALAVGGLGRTDAFQDKAHSGPAALAGNDPVPGILGVLAAGLLAAGVLRMSLVMLRRRSGVCALAEPRAMPASGDLIVIDEERPDA